MKSFCRAALGLTMAFLLIDGGRVQASAASPERALPSADEVIAKAVTRDQEKESSKSWPTYNYSKVTVTEEYDSSGKMRERKERLYQVSFKGGLTSSKLIQVNGRAPKSADLKRQADYEADARLLTGHSKSSRGDRHENILTPELVARYDFKMVGESQIDGRRAYEISFQPKVPPLPVHHIVDRLLNRISGELWIDAEEFEMARADLHLGSEVDLLGGVVGCLKKLAFTLTRTRIAAGVWLNTCSTGDFEGRKLLDSLRIKTRSQSLDFHPEALPFSSR